MKLYQAFIIPLLFVALILGVPSPASAAPSVSFVAGTSSGWDFQALESDIARNNTVDLNDLAVLAQNWLQSGCASGNNWCAGADLDASTNVDFVDYALLVNDWGKQAGQNVLLQTIYGNAQDSTGHITANSGHPLQNLKGYAMAFSVSSGTALDKGTFKINGVTAGRTMEIRLFNVTGKGYLTTGHTMSRSDPGAGSTAIADVTVNTPNTIPYHTETAGTQKFTDMVIDFGQLEITSGDYLLTFDCIYSSSTSLTTACNIDYGTGTQPAGMGLYPNGTPLPKRATITSSAAQGNTYWYNLGSSTDANYGHTANLFVFQITTAIVNHPPVVNAGTDQTIIYPINSVTLNGTATDDGIPNPPGVLTTTWSVTSGPGTVTFGDVHALNTTATFSTPGTYVLRLTANDGALSAYDEMSVTYKQNQAPVVNAGTDQSVGILDVTHLSGTVTDDGLPNPPGAVTTTWTQTSGPGTATFGSASNVNTTVSFSATGTYVLRLTASDSVLSSYDEVTITVVAGSLNHPPVVDAGSDQTITEPNTASLNGTVTDDGLPNPPGVVTVTWTMTSGPDTVTFGNASLVDTTASFSAAGTYVLRLTASDSQLSSYDEVTITVNPAPIPAAFIQWDGGLNHHMVGNEISYGRWEDANNWYCDAIPSRSRTLPTLSDTVKIHFFVTNDPPNPNNPAFNPQSHITIDTVGVAKAAKLQAKEYTNSLTILPGADLEVARNIEWYQDMNFDVHDLYIYGTVNACHEDSGQVRIGGEQSGSTNTVYVYGVLNAFGKSGGGAIWLSRSTIANGTMDHNRLYIYSTGIVTTDDLLMCPTCDCLIDVNSGGKLIVKANEKTRIDGYVASSLFAGDGVLGNVTVTYYADSNETVIQPAGVPQVDAGGDVQIINPVNSVSLNGTVIPDGTTTQWTQKSGPGTVVFADASQVDTTATFSAYGTYVLHLQATQSGKTGYDDVTITYLETPPP